MLQSFDLDGFLEDQCKELRTLYLTDIDPTHQFVYLDDGPDSMRDIRLPMYVEAREIKGLGENTRAWEILERDEGARFESFDQWGERVQRWLDTI